jgi:hypothetical protein
MRAFEFSGGEVEEKGVELMVVDLDSVVLLQKKFISATDQTRWIITLSSGDHLFVTKPAFDRISRALGRS